MTALYAEGAQSPWNVGASRYFVHEHSHPTGVVPTAVICRIGKAPETELALLDTGATFSVLSRDVLEEAGVEVTEDAVVDIKTRFGTMSGGLCRVPVTLVCERGRGTDVTVEATVLVVDEWPGPTVLGVVGFLERVRFALDPGTGRDASTFYFGLTG